jgi:hypothetical protein
VICGEKRKELSNFLLLLSNQMAIVLFEKKNFLNRIIMIRIFFSFIKPTTADAIDFFVSPLGVHYSEDGKNYVFQKSRHFIYTKKYF